MAAQRAKDEKLAFLLASIRVYLPSVRRPGGPKTSDYLVHPTALAHLRRRFNFVGSQLLRNDSLADMSDRSVLYIELYDWLEVRSLLQTSSPHSHRCLDYLLSRSTGKYDGNANHGRYVSQDCPFEEVAER